ncbi:hypothetical protein ZIOFF_030391 [Zingiber officinale]|uniref:Uncharacterized protein n=1 Tax=Zingiber officinale TaxID=94328 RepID=A0A8J5LBM8_ZINOF|nr:hypothetical protein ZIOFF_030391 [Zingiber officinale]
MDIETIVRDLGHEVTGVAVTRDEAVALAMEDRPGLCHQPVSSSTLPLSLLSALLPTLDWVTPAAYISPETAVGHIPIDPKPEQISDPSFEVKFYAVVGQSLHTVAIGSCNDGEFECHQPVSSSTLPLSLPSALLPTLDWVTPAAYLSPETAVGHIPIDPKPEQISDPSFEVKFYAVVGQSLHTVAIGSCNDGEFECHQPVSSSTLPLSLLSALLPTPDWVTPATYLSPETAVGHIPIDPKPEQISDPSFEVKFYAVVGQSLHTVAIGSCNDGEFEVRFRILNFE